MTEQPSRRAGSAGSRSAGREGARRSRAQAPRRIDVLVVLAMVLPSVVVVSLALLDGDDPQPSTHPPVRARLSESTVVCPSPVGGAAGDVRVTRDPRADAGEVEAGVARRNGKLREPQSVDADDSLTTVADSAGSTTVVTGRDAAAPGLVAGRDEAGVAAECREPWYDEWFVGLGAAARHSSTIELVNPDSAPAVVNIDVHGEDGLLPDASWRGITVPGRSVQQVDLSERPVRSAVSAHVTVTRGRVAASARHTFDQLGRGSSTTDHVPVQPQAATEQLLLGVPERGTQRALFVTNPGEDEVRATVRVVTEESTFEPADGSEIVVPPHSTREVALAGLVDGETASGMLGLQVRAPGPMLAGIRAVVDGDLTTLAPVTASDEAAVGVVPSGAKRLLLGAAIRAGTVRVTATASGGRVIWDERRVRISEGRAASVELPRDAERLVVEPRNTPIAATVATEESGLGQQRLAPARIYADVPDVASTP